MLAGTMEIRIRGKVELSYKILGVLLLFPLLKLTGVGGIGKDCGVVDATYRELVNSKAFCMSAPSWDLDR